MVSGSPARIAHFKEMVMSALRIVDSWTGVLGCGLIGVIPGDDWDFAEKESRLTLHRIDESEREFEPEIARRARRMLIEEQKFPPDEVAMLGQDELVECFV